MWNDLVKNLTFFSSAILTGVDREGYPFSVRCIPRIDSTRQVLHVQLPLGVAVQPGPAGLLCHSHDEWLWNIKSFIVRGALELEACGWIFRPKELIFGGGTGGFIHNMTQMFKWRRSARRYVQKRGLSWPAVPWEELKALRAQAKKENAQDRVEK